LSIVRTTPQRGVGFFFLLGCLVFCGASTFAMASDSVDGVTAVSSKASKNYVRTKLADGSYQPEFYSFGKGGNWGGEIKDATIDKLSFTEVARAIARPLASQKYLPARDPDRAKLLIMVYWGTTAVPGPTSDSIALDQFQAAQDNLNQYLVPRPRGQDPRTKVVAPGAAADAAMDQWSAAITLLNMENRQSDRADNANAALLGYDSPGLIGTEKGSYVRGTAFSIDRDDLYAEIRENRYFVILMAYDFQQMWKLKKHTLLWETRFSINERHNQFDKALPLMAEYASRYFGQDSNGLLRSRIPDGRVDVGELKSLGAVPEK
jgi:hypothetical protein